MDITNIKHNSVLQEFYLEDSGLKAYVKYQLKTLPTGPVCNFESTFVPNEWRGQGVAEALVRHSIHWGKENGYDLRASCWYAAKFLRNSSSH